MTRHMLPPGELRCTVECYRCRQTTTDDDDKCTASKTVSSSLTSPFSTYMAISETKGQEWRDISTQWRKASDILTSTLAAFWIWNKITRNVPVGYIQVDSLWYSCNSSDWQVHQCRCRYRPFHTSTNTTVTSDVTGLATSARSTTKKLSKDFLPLMWKEVRRNSEPQCWDHM